MKDSIGINRATLTLVTEIEAPDGQPYEDINVGVSLAVPSLKDGKARFVDDGRIDEIAFEHLVKELRKDLEERGLLRKEERPI